MAQQYSYGYGYQQYGYAQPATAAVPQAAATFIGYNPPRLPYTPTGSPSQQGTSSQQQQVNVGYSPYGSTTSTNQPPPPPGTNYGSQTPSVASQVSTSQPSYYSYKPQAPSYTPYYSGIQQSKSNTSITKTPSTPNTYKTSVSSTSSTIASPMVGYPSYSQTNYASSANAYYKHMKDSKTNPISGMGGYQSPYSGGAISPQQPPSTNASLTPVQQHVVQQYIHQKSHTPTGGGPRYKKSFSHSQNQQAHYCEVCKISAASALTYKTHLEGKSHKKKLAQQKITANQDKTSSSFYCELCDVMCSNRDGLEAHMRGSKHTKVVNLHKRLGKPIPAVKTPSADGTAGKTVMVTAPRISFVGGQQLRSTSTGEYTLDTIKVYPPPASSGDTVTTESGSMVANPSTPAPPEEEPEPVGEHLVVMVKGDLKFPHATHKCEMCDCYFNDEYAKKAHVKGRRHRLNYKKMYQPSLYVEPTKSMRKDIEKKKQHREMLMDLKKTTASYLRNQCANGRGRGGGVWAGHGNYTGGNFGNYNLGETWSGDSGLNNEARRKEDVSRIRQREESYVGYEEFYPPPMMSYQPHNPHDDKLVLNKHSLIYPDEDELKAVDSVVTDVEKALKNISDDLLNEKCQSANETGEDEAVSTNKDESKRELKGVMRVGAFARGLLLRGECSIELVLMTANKPDTSLFHILAGRIPAKFEELNESGEMSNIYNITPSMNKAAFIIISQVGDYCVQVSVTLTSASMRDEPTPEQVKADAEEGVLDRQSCIAALAALRHTKWFQAIAHNLPSCIICMRVIKDICRRVPAWGVLDTWILQLLVQKCIVSANSDFTKPGDIFRRVMECVASGLVLPGGPGLSDPCEKGAVDASVNLTAQERANITLSAQHALRLIAFDKLHLVLGVDPLPAPDTLQEEEAEDGKEIGDNDAIGMKREAENSENQVETKKMKLAE